MRKINYFLLVGTIILGNFGLNFCEAKVVTCDDVQFIFARGSGERLRDVSETAWRTQIESQLSNERTLKYSFYELGSAEQDGARYPAVAVFDSLEGYGNLFGAAVSGGQAFQFGDSVEKGMTELENYLKKVSASCSETKFVLGGYSQGAMVISQSLPKLDAEKIIYAATFGDPKLYLPEGAGQVPAACFGKDLSPYRRNVADCHAFEGILGSQQPYQPKGYLGKVGAWCNKEDLMCSSKWSVEDHTSYVKDGMYTEAAEYIAQILQQEFPHMIVIDWRKNASEDHNVVFVIDSTLSMTPLIKQYKREAKKLAQEVIETGGKVALFEYRDLDDPFETVQHCDLDCSYDEFVAELDSIEVGGGGDDNESTLSAMLYAMNHVDWQPGAQKSMVILTDSGYLEPDRDETTLRQVAARSVEIDPVNAYFVTSYEALDEYSELATALGGRVFNVNNEVTLSTQVILNRPVVKLAKTAYEVSVGSTLRFDASESYAVEGEARSEGKLRFDWDLDGDGEFEHADKGAVIDWKFAEKFSGYVQVRAVDEKGYSSTMSAKVDVGEEAEVAPATIQNLSATTIAAGASQVQFETNAERVLISVNDAIMGYVKAEAASEQILNLEEVKSGTEVKLVPFNTRGERGESVTIVLHDETRDEDQNNDDEKGDEGENDSVIIDSENESANEAGNRVSGAEATSAISNYDRREYTIPLPPNAGVGPKK